MKKITTTVIALFCMLNVALAKENNNTIGDQTTLISQKGSVVNVQYHCDKMTTLFIEIKNENGLIVYKEKVKAIDEFMKSFDLNDYGSGKYMFSLSDGQGNIERVIDIESAKKMALYRIDNSKRVRFVTKDLNQSLMVNIYDKKGKLVQQDYLYTGDNGICRIYNLSERRKGDTRIEIVKNSKVVKASKF